MKVYVMLLEMEGEYAKVTRAWYGRKPAVKSVMRMGGVDEQMAVELVDNGLFECAEFTYTLVECEALDGWGW